LILKYVGLLYVVAALKLLPYILISMNYHIMSSSLRHDRAEVLASWFAQWVNIAFVFIVIRIVSLRLLSNKVVRVLMICHVMVIALFILFEYFELYPRILWRIENPPGQGLKVLKDL
jgi:hypothetical protein